jgi:hypothetical protein
MKMATTAGTHQGAEAANRRHQQDQQAVLAATRLPIEPVAQPSCDAGPHQAFADHE